MERGFGKLSTSGFFVIMAMGLEDETEWICNDIEIVVDRMSFLMLDTTHQKLVSPYTFRCGSLGSPLKTFINVLSISL